MMTHEEILEVFFDRIYENDIHEKMLDDIDFIIPVDRVANFVQGVIAVPYREFLSYLDNFQSNDIKSYDITQCSSFKACSEDICYALFDDENRGKTFVEIGQSPIFESYIKVPGHVAWTKYGENQVKTASQLGLAFDYYDMWYLSCFGYVFLDLLPEDRCAFLARTLLRNPLYADIMRHIRSSSLDLTQYMSDLKPSTQGRRSVSVIQLLRVCFAEMDRSGLHYYDVHYPYYKQGEGLIRKCLKGTIVE